MIHKLKFIAYAHILGISFLSIFRLAQLSLLQELWSQAHSGWALKSFLLGIRFDNLMGCYLLFPPLILLAACSFLKKESTQTWSRPLAVTYFAVMYAVLFLFSAANIPYYAYFSQNLQASTLDYLQRDGNEALSMVWQDKSYLLYALAFVASTGLYARMLAKAAKHRFAGTYQLSSGGGNKLMLKTVSAYALVLLFAIIGARGSFSTFPLRLNEALFCDNFFLNSNAVNPAFYFLKSIKTWKNNNVQLTDEQEALAFMQRELGIDPKTALSPLGKTIAGDENPRKPNVVLVLMESMNRESMGRQNGKESLTPCLDSLERHSIRFENFYGTGEHTSIGVYSCLTSYPVAFHTPVMEESTTYASSFGQVLSEAGYHTRFFIPHSPNYDNMKPFLLKNGFEVVYGQDDYDPKAIVNTWGVSDRYLLDFSLQQLDSLPADKPFAAVILTVSNHPPYYIPADFQTPGLSPDEQMTRYADACIGRFISRAAQCSWYHNTVFAFVADHGKAGKSSETAIPMSFHHIPFLIHAPFLKARTENKLASQLDVTPTLLGIAGISYERNSYGIDLLKEERNVVCISSDNRLGALDSTCFYVYDQMQKRDFVYRKQGDSYRPANNSRDMKAAERLKEYCFYFYQSANWMRLNRKHEERQ